MKKVFKKRVYTNQWAYEYVETLYRGCLPLKDFLQVLKCFEYTKLTERDAKDFFALMNCFVVIEELVKFYPFIYAMRFGKTGEIYDGTFKSTKKLFKTFKTKDDAARFM